jgi:hypothetical protein
MLTADRTPTASGRRESFELQVFRDGHWIFGAVCDDRAQGLREMLRLDRSGRLVRLQAATLDATGKANGSHVLYPRTAGTDTRIGDRRHIAVGTRPSHRPPSHAEAHPASRLNPYILLATFSLIVFLGIAAILALRTLHDAV